MSTTTNPTYLMKVASHAFGMMMDQVAFGDGYLVNLCKGTSKDPMFGTIEVVGEADSGVDRVAIPSSAWTPPSSTGSTAEDAQTVNDATLTLGPTFVDQGPFTHFALFTALGEFVQATPILDPVTGQPKTISLAEGDTVEVAAGDLAVAFTGPTD